MCIKVFGNQIEQLIKNGRLLAPKEVFQEICRVDDQLRAFLSSNKLIIYKLGDDDAVVVRLDR